MRGEGRGWGFRWGSAMGRRVSVFLIPLFPIQYYGKGLSGGVEANR